MQMKHWTWGRWLRIGITLAGLGLAVVALALDVITGRPGDSIGPLQIVLALVGLGGAVVPWIGGGWWGKLALVIGTLLLMLVVLEIALAALGYEPEYRAPPPDETPAPLERDPAKICDAAGGGCRWDADILAERCGPRQDRLCVVNPQGFNDADTFSAEAVNPDAYRILVLGDSFTWGASAALGQGWVDVVERTLSNEAPLQVWNAAYPGTGQQQALASARRFLPVMQPDLVILGVHTGNDLADNQYPPDRFARVIGADGAPVDVQQYTLDDANQPVLETDAVIDYRSRGYTVSSPVGWRVRIEDALTRTRLGTLLVGGLRLWYERGPQIAITRDLLAQLRAEIEAAGSRLMVVILPERADATQPTRKYQAVVGILDDIGIPYLDPRPQLSDGDFINPNPTDEHLNTAGHAVVGDLVTVCLRPAVVEDAAPCVVD